MPKEIKGKTRLPTADAIERKRFVKALVEVVKRKNNEGFTPDDFFDYLAEINIPLKSRDKRNDFLNTVQKAGQDYRIVFFNCGNRLSSRYYADNQTAWYLRTTGRSPVTDKSKLYCGSKRGLIRRKKTKKTGEIRDLIPRPEPKGIPRSLKSRRSLNSDSESSSDSSSSSSCTDSSSDSSSDSDNDSGDDVIRPIESKPMVAIETCPVKVDDMEDMWDDAFDAGNSTSPDNVREGEDVAPNESSFAFPASLHPYKRLPAHFSQPAPPDIASPPDYSLSECLTFQGAKHTTIKHWTFDGRFYFVTTFLHREGLITDVDFSTLQKITHGDLQRYFEALVEKYSQYEDLGLERDLEENPADVYCLALKQSFQYPNHLAQPELGKYFELASQFHNKSVHVEAIRNQLCQPLYKRRV